jgi:hypothetical protein
VKINLLDEQDSDGAKLLSSVVFTFLNPRCSTGSPAG